MKGGLRELARLGPDLDEMTQAAADARLARIQQDGHRRQRFLFRSRVHHLPYLETRPCVRVFGHSRLQSTGTSLGTEVEDALDLPEQTGT